MATTTSKKIGKILSISFGFGGYQDAMLGLSVDLGSDNGSNGSSGWGTNDFRGGWGPHIIPNEHFKWTEADRSELYASTVRFVGELLTQAKKDKLSDLAGVPVEVEFSGNTLKSWRILTEAI